jgi:hypothetical protein
MKFQARLKTIKRHLSIANNILSPIRYIFISKVRRVRYIYTPLDEAVKEIEKRRKDPVLKKAVESYINGPIPEYFQQSTPVFTMSRYLATPNLEMLYAVDRTENYNYPLIVTEDHKSKFISHSELKRALTKLPVIKGWSRHKDEIIEYFTIVDYKKYHGKKLNEVETKCNESLTSFHRSLMHHMRLDRVTVVNETQWIDTHHRENVKKQYTQLLALLCIHGIMLEAYPPAERTFALDIVYPALREVEKALGVKPLIVEHITDEEDFERDWNAYPAELYDLILSKCSNNSHRKGVKKML